MKNKFLIGDMAKIHNVTTQTLRYYDKIGILKPKIVDKYNGYRYYTVDQFDQLDTIKYLKFLGMSLNDIKEHFEKKELGNVINKLEKQKELTHKKIGELELILSKINNKINCINDCINIEQEQYETIRIKEILERSIAYEDINDFNSVIEFELNLKKLQNLFRDNYLMFTGVIGVIVPEDNIKNNRFERYNTVYVLVEDEIKYRNIKKIPAGKYACIYHKGSYKENYRSYEKLIHYLRSNNYQIAGDAVEIGLIDCSVTLNEDEYLTEIQIPIK